MKKFLLIIVVLLSLRGIGQRVTDNNTLLTKSEVSGGVPLTLTAHTWNGVVIGSTYGGTGVNNGGRTLTINTNSGTISFGAASKTFTLNNTLTLSGTDGSTLNIGSGGTLGSNAYTSTAYVPTTTTVAGFALSSNVSLAALTATNSTLTFSGSYDGSTARTVGLNLGNANTWTAAQTNEAAAPQIVLGKNVTTLGSIKMFGNTSGDVTIQPTAAAGTATVQTLPATTGTLVNRVTTANGVSATNSDGALTISLGAITPSSSTISGLMKANSLNFGMQSIATSAGTTTLTASSVYQTIFTGSTTQNCDLPDATTLTVGHRFKISNNSTGIVTVRTNGGATLWTLGSSTDIELVCTDVGTAAGTWEKDYRVGNAATGKVMTLNNSITITGTDATTMTFPSTSATIARTDAAQTFTGVQTLSSAPVLSTGTVTVSGNTITFPTSALTLATITGTETLTNKRVTQRTGSTTSSATPTINSDNVDKYALTAQTVDITSFTTNLSGTPTDGQELTIEVTGTASRAITWGASFEASSIALPTTTSGTSMLTCVFKWNTATSKWRLKGYY